MIIGISIRKEILSDYWTGFNKFTLLEENPPPDGYMWSRERLTRKQLTSRPDYLWSHEKLHLDNARKLRGIYFH